MNTITLLAIIAILAGTASVATTTGFSVAASISAQMENATTAANMTGGNMTTDAMNATGSISGKRS
jgi:hypothetical protein